MIFKLEDTNENRLLLIILELQQLVFTVERVLAERNRRRSILQHNGYYVSQSKSVFLQVHIDKRNLNGLGLDKTIERLFNTSVSVN